MPRQRIELTRVLEILRTLDREEKFRTTLLGVNPMSEEIIRACLLVAKEYDFPMSFIASRNQVEREEMGGGYLNNWTPQTFVDTVSRISDEVSFNGIVFIARDHGGPWKNDKEKKARLPEKEAIDSAALSFYTDLHAGFDMLHIDTTADPDYKEQVPLDIVKRRLLKLVRRVEAYRIENKLPPVAYEVGTEDAKGGLTDITAFEGFLKTVVEELKSDNLPVPAFIVGQTGTQICMRDNIDNTDFNQTKALTGIAERYGVAFKEHNADYTNRVFLKAHPELKIRGANTGPSFSIKQTEMYMELAKLEKEAFENRKIGSYSGYLELLRNKSIESGGWRKWLFAHQAGWTVDYIREDPDRIDIITAVAGRYAYDDPDVSSAYSKMCENLKKLRISDNPEVQVVEKIKEDLIHWVDDFNLAGVTSRILKRL